MMGTTKNHRRLENQSAKTHSIRKITGRSYGACANHYYFFFCYKQGAPTGPGDVELIE